MHRLVLLGVLAAACSGGKSGDSTTPKKGPLTAKDIVKQASPAIVFIEVGDGDQRATGTGFVLDKTGLIATNFHVVRGNKTIKVKLYGGEVYPATQIAGVDPGRDLALLRIQPAKALPTLRLGDSDQMSAGDRVITIGNPLGMFDYSVSSGDLSQVRPVCSARVVEYARANQQKLEGYARKKASDLTEADRDDIQKLLCQQELTYFQISAPISQGSSGGPLFNQNGEVVGVTTAIIAAGQNINLAIPTNYLKPMVARPESISLDEFATKTKEDGDDRPIDKTPIERKIPDHPMVLLDGCKGEQIVDLENQIWGAIGVGAPLYNKGELEACFRIYEGLATKLEHDAPCKGIKVAFGDGLLRANSIEGYKAKAWAMRDTFDGLLDVGRRWRDANPGKWSPEKLKSKDQPYRPPPKVPAPYDPKK
jgi:serine protease Do